MAWGPGLRRGLRVPLLQQADVAPTVAALLGLPALREARGRDLFASGAPEQRPAVYLNSLEASTVPRFALVADGYKYMLSTDGAGQRESLFQLDDETNDLADSMPERLRAMRQQLAAIRDALPASPRREEQQLSPEDREMLRALGYGDPSAER